MKKTALEKPPAHQLLLSYLDEKLVRRGPKAIDLSGIKTATYLLANMSIPGRELSAVVLKLQEIASRNLVAAAMLRELIATLKYDHDNFVR